jgi:hypothetical protein
MTCLEGRTYWGITGPYMDPYAVLGINIDLNKFKDVFCCRKRLGMGTIVRAWADADRQKTIQRMKIKQGAWSQY